MLVDSGNFKTDAGEMIGEPRTVTCDDDAAVYILRKDDIESTPDRPATEPGRLERGSRPPDTSTPSGATRTASASCSNTWTGWTSGYRLQAGDLDANGDPIDPALVGFYNTAMAPNSCSEVMFDPVTGASKQVALLRDDDWTWNLQLSAMDWSTEALTAPTLHHIAYQGFRPGAVTHRAIENYGDRVGPLPAEDTPGVLASLHRRIAGAGRPLGVLSTPPTTSPPPHSPLAIRTPAAPTGDRSRYAGQQARRPRRIRGATSAERQRLPGRGLRRRPRSCAGPIATLSSAQWRVRTGGTALGLDADRRGRCGP